MGILNITPDSFSRDGLLLDELELREVMDLATQRAERMVADGAQLIDIGGESTRPSTVGANRFQPTLSARESCRSSPRLLARLSAHHHLDRYV